MIPDLFNHSIGHNGWHSGQGFTSSGNADGTRSFAPSGENGEWVKIHFKTTSIMLKKIHVYARPGFGDRAPDAGFVYGSNDGSNWTELINYTGLQNSGGNNGYQDNVAKIITIDSSVNYSYFVILVNKVGNGVWLNVSEIELYPWDGGGSGGSNTTGFTSTGTLGTDFVSTWTIPTDAPATMYYASDGSANAGGTINISNFTPINNNTLLIETNTDISGTLAITGGLTVNGVSISSDGGGGGGGGGNLTESDIPNLSANKITTDTLGADRIPNLSANKITTDTLGQDRIPNLSANKITSDTLQCIKNT